MMLETRPGISIDVRILRNYFKNLVNLFFKILPIREKEEASLVSYMQSLQIELLGCKELIVVIQEDPYYMSLLSILEYLINHPECSISQVRREVFKAISICNKLQSKYAAMSEGEV